MNYRMSAPVLAVLALSSCGGLVCKQSRLPEATLKRAAENNQPPECDTASCPDKWARAQIWIAQNSDMKIQLVTDALIETYNPTESSYGYRVTKLPLGGGKYRMDLTPTWGGSRSLNNCGTDPGDLRSVFYYYLNTGNDLGASGRAQSAERKTEAGYPAEPLIKFPWQK